MGWILVLALSLRKGYITNTTLKKDDVIDAYSNLWHIEKAFRMSKSDLQIRPIYHFAKRRIEAHISISFVAYTVYKELERILYKHNAPFSVQKARDIIHNIYQLEITLPDSQVKEKGLLQSGFWIYIKLFIVSLMILLHFQYKIDIQADKISKPSTLIYHIYSIFVMLGIVVFLVEMKPF